MVKLYVVIIFSFYITGWFNSNVWEESINMVCKFLRSRFYVLIIGYEFLSLIFSKLSRVSFSLRICQILPNNFTSHDFSWRSIWRLLVKLSCDKYVNNILIITTQTLNTANGSVHLWYHLNTVNFASILAWGVYWNRSSIGQFLVSTGQWLSWLIHRFRADVTSE